MTTSVGADRRGVTRQRTSETVSEPVSVVNSSHIAPPSTNRSTGPSSRTSWVPSTAAASTMRHTLLVSDAMSRTRPEPDAVSCTSTSAAAVHRCQYVAWKRPKYVLVVTAAAGPSSTRCRSRRAAPRSTFA